MIIDCPPSISSLSLSAFKAADEILVPMLADQFSVHGLPFLIASLKKYSSLFDIDARIGGVVFSMFPPENDEVGRAKAEQYAEDIAKLCTQSGIALLSSRISRDPEYPTSYDNRRPLPFYERKPEKLIEEIDKLAVELGLGGERR